MWEIFDNIRQLIMEKMVLRNRIGHSYDGHLIIPIVIKNLHARGRNMQGDMSLLRVNAIEAELTYVFRDCVWRYPVNLGNKKCSCKRWEISGKPCIHALYFLNYIGGETGKVDPYVSEYFSVDKFKLAYADNVPALLGREQWDEYNPGFKLHPPALHRAPVRPRVNRLRPGAEGAAVKRRPCKRCGIEGHIQRLCNNAAPSILVTDQGWGADEAAEAAEETAMAAEAAALAQAVAREFAERYVCLEWLSYALVNIFSIFVNICFT